MLSSAGSPFLYCIFLVRNYVKVSQLPNNVYYAKKRKILPANCFMVILPIHKLLLYYHNYVYAFTDTLSNVTFFIALFIMCRCFIILPILLLFNTIELTNLING